MSEAISVKTPPPASLPVHPPFLEEQTAIHCENVCKQFVEYETGTRSWQNFFRGERKVVNAVDHVSFSIHRGEIFGLLGQNGSGKSTLIRLISTLLHPDEGRITVFGKDVIKQAADIRPFINRVSVEASFFKKLSAVENLRYAARLYGLPVKEGEEKALAILERLGIPKNKIYSPLETHSRGMQQKAAIARALMTAPTLVLLDEPTTGLDPTSKREVQRFVQEVRSTHDATMLLTTHDMEEAERLCDRIAVIDRGAIVALDTPAGLKKQIGTDSLEEVFFQLTGVNWEDIQYESN
ncbi:ABC transporter ATP-binding protein [Mechercharimyces sp. CAU 1602]|uniref:ABC transporter ATP-binding protein n=1 Tax=Mechercharimyces sp. CAU 1602 TaxID=2973933 RepID=UPI0021632E9F|nr:ABC transporter ATP-binding protein [Mechercharimyces sp. CAU 1602]MCS1352475.1 ABC transporter ATP-binding protein [Mechercharimyces sp. CAU 1602]